MFTAESIAPVLRAIPDINGTYAAVATQSREHGHTMAASPWRNSNFRSFGS